VNVETGFHWLKIQSEGGHVPSSSTKAGIYSPDEELETRQEKPSTTRL
jgi:hypothetical protein